jgi:hypothetical protein
MIAQSYQLSGFICLFYGNTIHIGNNCVFLFDCQSSQINVLRTLDDGQEVGGLDAQQ